MGFCRDLGTTYVIGVDAVVLLLGVALTALGIYIMLDERDLANIPGFDINGNSPLSNDTGIDVNVFTGVGNLVLGVLTMMLAYCGCYGTKYDNRGLLTCHNVFMLLLSVGLLTGGVFGFAHSGALDEIADSLGIDDNSVNGTLSGTIRTSSGKTLNDQQLALFEECCGDVIVGLPKIEQCDFNRTSTSAACYYDQATFDVAKDLVISDVCIAVAQLDWEGSPLIGVPSPENPDSCGGKDPKQFQFILSDLASEYAYWISLAWTILGSVFLFAFICGCCICCNEERQLNEYKQDSWDANKLTGTAPVNDDDPSKYYETPNL